MRLRDGQQETNTMTGFGNCHTRTSLEQRVHQTLPHHIQRVQPRLGNPL
ncbi:hypothetical protein IWX65_003111 [Arthrobacter sp. CAN_A214]